MKTLEASASRFVATSVTPIAASRLIRELTEQPEQIGVYSGLGSDDCVSLLLLSIFLMLARDGLW